MKSITLSILLMLCACCAWCVKLPVLPRTEDIRSYRFLLKRTLSVITPDNSLTNITGQFTYYRQPTSGKILVA
jgi:hypothetical protein